MNTTGWPARFGRIILAAGLLLGVPACDSLLREQVERLVDACQEIRSEKVVYVDGNSGDDRNPGTRAEPRSTIQSGIDLAASLLEQGEVRVAGGSYTISATLVVKEGISLCGGYSAADWTRNPAQHETMIQASGIDIAIAPEEGVTMATMIDGLTIRSAWRDTAICILCDMASPTVRYCTLDASAGTEDSIGIYNKNSTALIMSNTINAGHGSSAAWGIVNVTSPVAIRNNLIYGDSAAGKYIGIYNSSGSDAVIQSNTIRAGTSAGDGGLCNAGSQCIIENNILFSDGQGCGIWEKDSAALPQRLRSNDLHDCSPAYRHGSDSFNVNEIQSHLPSHGVECSGNIEGDPLFEEESAGDWHLQDGSPAESAGLDLSSSFTTDRDGVARTVPWSMGAYEKD